MIPFLVVLAVCLLHLETVFLNLRPLIFHFSKLRNEGRGGEGRGGAQTKKGGAKQDWKPEQGVRPNPF